MYDKRSFIVMAPDALEIEGGQSDSSNTFRANHLFC